MVFIRSFFLAIQIVILCISVSLRSIAQEEVGAEKEPDEEAIIKKFEGTKIQTDEIPRAIPQEYLIGPEDVISIDVWKSEELSREVTVRPDGQISLPLIGEVYVQNMTTNELANLLTKKYRDFVPTAVVSVTVRSVNSFKIFVLGRVVHSGMYTVKANVNVLQTLALAGGFTPFARTSKIKVLRFENEGWKVFDFNYNHVKKGLHLEQNILLKPGDIVVVP